jgi:pyruvate,orthophosphate dikinase
MKGLPGHIRLLDPPLHEFLPARCQEPKDGRQAAGRHPGREGQGRASLELHEINPMLGPPRLPPGVTYPEILEMQVRRSSRPRSSVGEGRSGRCPEIMIPLVGTAGRARDAPRAVRGDHRRDGQAEPRLHRQVDIKIGTMIEIPRAALTADEIAEVADFFSFGTNDLTQMTFGYSRDDVNTFLPDYIEQEILPVDPFQSSTRRASASWSRWASRRPRSTRTSSSASAASTAATPRRRTSATASGLDYVSCSPFRVPIARLAAAQAAISSVMRSTRRGIRSSTPRYHLAPGVRMMLVPRCGSPRALGHVVADLDNIALDAVDGPRGPRLS